MGSIEATPEFDLDEYTEVRQIFNSNQSVTDAA